ncbi:copper oxidase [Anoxybacillus ayderensis]|uniref:multicopper oxidase family protein n=1 Tax=Anoxybacillus sp. ST70 TaxID=2864180 RepID=UPI0002E6DF4F|nr:multicopper oxidase family protein [Anoxybacillus sp. ST70]AXM90168.1 multicopper oxidase family protein [Anoxybacillus ayderensis G10]MBW9218275.1 multicopper oxidase family protein [Anoxybacillus sp. ST70]THD17648.1 copper oxidase [Anoxybacillus ayderensis]
MKKLWLGTVLVGVIALSAACSNSMQGHDMSNMHTKKETTSNKENLPLANDTEALSGKEIHLTAKETLLQINDQVQLPVYTYNGSVPGAQIRVKQGERVKIVFKNELPEPTAIHWHGYPVPNDQDGVPGVTMDAIKPRETFTYEFTATVPGTYWYHSHQKSAEQVDKGLYGTLIVEPKEGEQVDRDYTLVLDEWMSQQQASTTEQANHTNMHHGNSSMMHDMSMYDIFTINGKSGQAIEPLKVKKGEKVRLRLINAGYMSHKLHLHGHSFKIVATDGQPLNDPQLIKDELLNIAPGERYDIEFIADNPGEWLLECHEDMKGTDGMKVNIQYEGQTNKADKTNAKETLPVVDITTYGKYKTGPFTLDQTYDVEYTMDLGTAMDKNGMVFTINGKTYPNTAPINVKKGDIVKVKLVNSSPMDVHPMHLHGHFFQILSKNGKPVTGSPLIKDSLNINPGEEYVVAFQADNPGNWMFHCHDLHHASAGMVTELKYKDYKSSYTPDPNDTTNKGE